MTVSNWHNRLDQALKAGNAEKFAEIAKPMPYGSTQEMAYDGVFCTVTRENDGRYETAITYATLMSDFVRVA